MVLQQMLSWLLSWFWSALQPIEYGQATSDTNDQTPKKPDALPVKNSSDTPGFAQKNSPVTFSSADTNSPFTSGSAQKNSPNNPGSSQKNSPVTTGSAPQNSPVTSGSTQKNSSNTLGPSQKSSSDSSGSSEESPPLEENEFSLDKDIIESPVKELTSPKTSPIPPIKKKAVSDGNNKEATDDMIREAWNAVKEKSVVFRINVAGESGNCYRSLKFHRWKFVHVLPKGFRHKQHQRAPRVRHDAWRRYSALATIHELGGWLMLHSPISVSNPDGRSYIYVKPKTALKIPPPELPPLMTEEDLQKRPMTVLEQVPPKKKKGKKSADKTRRSNKS
ncbi:hypothetical protein QR680_007459 [Steinernema hermaphroditum]|uniref:Uncharacterized protein n=1 Tax=Steinernema hermaphroditum TaxID=289476 RepID=A0AA39ID82_9BILA|nr:hypothetical protein QR680_007459 [Steinernema hermaphroditum]